jgi:hypothetical protein
LIYFIGGMKMKKVLIVCMLLIAFALGLASCTDGAVDSSDVSENIATDHTHQFSKWKEVVAPTCTEEGLEERACECGEIEEREIAMLGHTVIVDKRIAPTCTKEGLTEGSHCFVCREVLMEQMVLEATGHSFVDHFCFCGVTDGEVSAGLFYELREDGQSYRLTGIGVCKDTEISIAPTYKYLPVTEIGEMAFGECKEITSITIPDSVTFIARNAFHGCSKLTNVNIPNSVTSIGFWAFAGCDSLEEVIIPEGVTTIENDAFYRCRGLISITIPKSVTHILDSVFCDCFSLKNITLHDELKEIGNGAFTNCKSLESIVIPDSVTTIGVNAFMGCEKLTNVTMGKGITNLGEDVFSDCPNLTSITYKGTKAEWNELTKNFWNMNVGEYTVHCTDGDIEK